MWIAAGEPCKLVGRKPLLFLAILLQTGKFTALPNNEENGRVYLLGKQQDTGDNEQLRRDLFIIPEYKTYNKGPNSLTSADSSSDGSRNVDL